MNHPPQPLQSDNAAQLLSDIKEMLKTRGALDEARGKQLRKRYNTLVGVATAANAESATSDLEAVTGALRNLREKIDIQVRKRRDRMKAVREELAQYREQLEQGHVQSARDLSKKIHKALGRIPGLSDGSKKEITDALDEMRPQLKELGSWQHWGTNRAREMLIEQVRALEGGNLPLPEVARRVQQARDAWSDLDGKDKPAPHWLWQRFDKVCTRTYEPCRQYFKEQARRYDENLRGYKELCEALEAAVAGAENRDADLGTLDSLLRKSHGARRKFVLRRKDVDKMAPRFDKAVAQLDELLDPERRRSLRRRRQLIDNIRTLHEAGEVNKAADAVIEAQANWKPLVLSEQAVEKQLWSDFRALCDEVFAHKKQQHKETRKVEQDSLKQRRQACTRINEILASDNATVLAADGEIARIKESWGAMGAVSRRDRDGIEKEFRDCLDAWRKRLRNIGTERKQTLDDSLEQRAALCLTLETTPHKDGADYKSLIGKSRKAWDATTAIADAELQQALEKRFESAVSLLQKPTPPPAELKRIQNNLEARLELCLRLEILSGVESPPEYAARKMQIQTQRLADAMSGKGDARDNPAQFRDLCHRYWSSEAVPATEAQAMEQRFQTARAAFQTIPPPPPERPHKPKPPRRKPPRTHR